jgi:hypothetical protein
MSIDAQITAFLEGVLVIATSSVNLLILFIKFKSNNVPAQLKDRKTIPFWATLLINAHVPGGGDTHSACKPAAFTEMATKAVTCDPFKETYTSSLGKSSGPARD